MRPTTYNDSGNRLIPQQQNRKQQIMTQEPTPNLTEVQRNIIIAGLIRDIRTIRYSATLTSIEKDDLLKNVSNSLKAIHDN